MQTIVYNKEAKTVKLYGNAEAFYNTYVSYTCNGIVRVRVDKDFIDAIDAKGDSLMSLPAKKTILIRE